jgi:hypothetical protein
VWLLAIGWALLLRCTSLQVLQMPHFSANCDKYRVFPLPVFIS